MQLSKKLKSFSELFSAVLSSRLNFELFKKKDHPHSLCIPQIKNCERRC